MGCCCGDGGSSGGIPISLGPPQSIAQPIDVRTTKFASLLTGVGDSLNYDGKISTLWVGGQSPESQATDLSDTVNNLAWWGQVLVAVAGTAAVVWIVHKMFDKR